MRDWCGCHWWWRAGLRGWLLAGVRAASCFLRRAARAPAAATAGAGGGWAGGERRTPVLLVGTRRVVGRAALGTCPHQAFFNLLGGRRWWTVGVLRRQPLPAPMHQPLFGSSRGGRRTRRKRQRRHDAYEEY